MQISALSLAFVMGYRHTSEDFCVQVLRVYVRRATAMGHCGIQDSFSYELVTMYSDTEETRRPNS